MPTSGRDFPPRVRQDVPIIGRLSEASQCVIEALVQAALGSPWISVEAGHPVKLDGAVSPVVGHNERDPARKTYWQNCVHFSVLPLQEAPIVLDL